MSIQAGHENILRYWLGAGELHPSELTKRLKLWFSADPGVDAELESRFGDLIEAASSDRLLDWKPIPRGRLALIVLLDQFRRNVFRDCREAFSADNTALALCREGTQLGMDHGLSILERAFFYMPLQHAEDLVAQAEGVEAFRQLTQESSAEMRPAIAEFLGSAKQHHEIIARFGRFPHRNAALNRECTPAEAAYLLSERIPFRK
ncbi:MAG: DUF924 family protein [Acidiferrobacterales bacterium]